MGVVVGVGDLYLWLLFVVFVLLDVVEMLVCVLVLV